MSSLVRLILRRSQSSSYRLINTGEMLWGKKVYLNPQSCPLTNSRQLSGLEMGEPQRRQITILCCEGGQPGNKDRQGANKVVKALTQEDEIGVAIAKEFSFGLCGMLGFRILRNITRGGP